MSLCLCVVQYVLLSYVNSRVEAIRRGRHFSQKRVVLNQSGCICPPKQRSRYLYTNIISTIATATTTITTAVDRCYCVQVHSSAAHIYSICDISYIHTISNAIMTPLNLLHTVALAVACAAYTLCIQHVMNRSRSRTSRHTRELQKRLNTARIALAKLRKAEQSSEWLT